MKESIAEHEEKTKEHANEETMEETATKSEEICVRAEFLLILNFDKYW